MFAKLTRAAALMTFAATAALTLPACAETAVATSDTAARVEYRYFGQGGYTIAMPTTSGDRAPYALTGRRPVDNGANSANVRVVDFGQGRYVVPTGR